MKRFIVLLALFACSQSFAVSFDCAKFNTGVYKIICESPELSKLDDELSEKYAAATEIFKDDNDFKEAIRASLKNRDLCKDEECLIVWYKKALDAYKLLDDIEKPKQETQASNWILSSNGHLMSFSKGGEFLAIAAINDAGYYWMYFSSQDPKFKYCRDGEGVSQSPSVNFNGVLVRMIEMCDNGIKFFTPVTLDGARYVLNQFITKNEVILINAQNRVFANFSAVGFKAGLEQIRQYRGGI